MDKKANVFSIKFKKDSLYMFVLFIYIFLAYATSYFSLPEIYLQCSLYIFFLFSFIRLLLKKAKIPITFISWYAGFLLICTVSLLYASSLELSINMSSNLLMAFFFGISMSVFLQIENGSEKLMKIFIITGLIVGTFLALTFSPEHSWSRLGEDFGVNENLVGLMYLIPLCFAFVNLYRKSFVTLSALAAIVCGYNVLISGSKKAVLGFLVFVLVYLISEKKVSKKIRNTILIIFMVMFVSIMIMNTPSLYNVVGYRFEMMYQNLINDSGTNSSTTIRINMIQYGLHLFAESPIWGYGINNFAHYWSMFSGKQTYSHNNYIELLVDLGILGFIIYYSVHFYLAKKLLKTRKCNVPNRAIYFALLALILFYDFGMVSYYDTRIITLIVFVIYGTVINVKRKQGEIAHEAIVNSKRL
ncbi:O-antigen ligase family protein [Phosphitispora fastidiosa]|uniref:O-antigen ligase family protein n=1 Tax=Phosphitispora fastidiosa TaxID=2837202 RepID=UPI001E38C3E0|nr:O-antigen ligase family protein [Phosphitispora fastidiosa]MBU7007222.1 O-antigen ligase [Phosphitispora fastidiosa]